MANQDSPSAKRPRAAPEATLEDNGVSNIPGIRAMMKECVSEQLAVGTDALVVMSRATELVLKHLIATSLAKSPDPRTVDYAAVAAAVASIEGLTFLQDFVPPQVRYGDVKQQLPGADAQKS